MSENDGFEVTEEGRKIFLEKILKNLPKEERIEGKKTIETITNNYKGRDVDALSVLMYASERGKFDEYVTKLNVHHKENLKYIMVEARRMSVIPGARRAEAFIIGCYKEMGIKPQKE